MDTCDVQIGCILVQKRPDGTDRLIGYWSCSLKDAKLAYNTAHCKSLEVVWAGFLFRPYPYYCRFTVPTDHRALKGILNWPESTGKLACWRLRLTEFKFGVVFCAVVEHDAGCALSLQITKWADKMPTEDDIKGLCMIAYNPINEEERFYTWKTMRHRAT